MNDLCPYEIKNCQMLAINVTFPRSMGECNSEIPL